MALMWFFSLNFCFFFLKYLNEASAKLRLHFLFHLLFILERMSDKKNVNSFLLCKRWVLMYYYLNLNMAVNSDILELCYVLVILYVNWFKQSFESPHSKQVYLPDWVACRFVSLRLFASSWNNLSVVGAW